MFIERTIEKQLKQAINGERKVIIIYGPRQAGKTTLIKLLTSKISGKVQFFIGDDLHAQDLFSKNDLEALRRAIGLNLIRTLVMRR